MKMASVLRKRSTVSAVTFGLLFFAWSAFAIDVEVAQAPRTNLSLLLNAFKSAKRKMLINIYELTSPEIAQAIIDRIEDGIEVQILLEGEPVGGVTTEGKKIRNLIVRAMKRGNSKNRFYNYVSDEQGERRFAFNHAKYLIVDGRDLVIGSENYSPTGHSDAETKGNRGWEVLIHDTALAKKFEEMFRLDSDPSHGDVIELVGRSQRKADFSLLNEKGTAVLPLAGPVLSASEISVITSPETSLSGLLRLINRAKQSIDVEQMDFPHIWRTSDQDSPIANALIAAARRGVEVRVLLNDEAAFMDDDDDHGNYFWDPESRKTFRNYETVKFFNELRKTQGLSIWARIADVNAMGVSYIHNKGMLVDGTYTLVSSINWSENSIVNNRETAVFLTSPSIFSFYKKLFEQDWVVSSRNFTPASLEISWLGIPVFLQGR